MTMPIRTVGDPVLRNRASEIVEISDETRRLAREMLLAMYEAKGVGLAAPQVGEPIRLIVLDCSSRRDGSEAMALVNPVLVDTSGLSCEEEGCLSVPDFRAEVTRPENVRVRAFSLSGREIEITADDILARALQHEIDHLDGVLFIDRIAPERRRAFERRSKARTAVST
jgi:peptide deformylase